MKEKDLCVGTSSGPISVDVTKEKVRVFTEAETRGSTSGIPSLQTEEDVYTSITPPELPKPIEKISEQDRLALDLAKERKLTAEAQLQTAQAKMQTADLAFRYVVLQLYHKYGLVITDQLSEDGSITYHRNNLPNKE